MASGWFSMSLHALALLATSKDGFSSKYLAGSVNTNAVFLRRVLAQLVRAGIIETREGRDGGYRLLKVPEQLTLAEVYKVMEMEQALAPSPAEPNPACPIGLGIASAFQQLSTEVEHTILSVLERYTVADMRDLALSYGPNIKKT
jgi:Rrf2 family transcriptional repressor of oqxAB